MFVIRGTSKLVEIWLRLGHIGGINYHRDGLTHTHTHKKAWKWQSKWFKTSRGQVEHLRLASNESLWWIRASQRGSLRCESGVRGMLVGCPAGDEWTWQSAAGYQSGLVSVSAGATLYVFLCIFFRERRRSGRGRRCRKRPQVSNSFFSLLFFFSLSVASWGCDFYHLSPRLHVIFYCVFSLMHTLYKNTNLSVDIGT